MSMSTAMCRLQCLGLVRRAANRKSLHEIVQPICRRNISSTANAPLDGIRVVDLTRVLAGPYCTMILGDLGAEVIKVERPKIGDETRNWGPPWVKKESTYFISINRNKKSIEVDLKKPDGIALLKKLIKKSDVFIENYLPGKLSAMGIGYDQLKEENPGLIYCSITGWGQSGPYKNRAGYDVIAAGIGGLMHITGPRDGEPARVGVAMTDLSTGLYAYGAIMAALLHRQKTGNGQHIDCNLLATQIATISHIASNYLNAGMEASRHGTGHQSIVPYQAFKTKDDCYITIGAGNNLHFKYICERMSLPQVFEDPRYATNESRVKHRKVLITTMSERFQDHTLSEWLEKFDGCKFPYGPINNMQQVFSDPQVLQQDLVQEFEHPTVGKVRIPGPAVKYSQSEVVFQRPPPTLGQHTEEVLQNLLEYTPQDIEALKENGTI